MHVASHGTTSACLPLGSYANNAMILTDLLAASSSRLSWPAGIIIYIVLIASYLVSSTTGIRINIVLEASYLISTWSVSSSISYLPRCIIQLPTVSVPLRAVLNMSRARRPSCCVSPTIVLATGVLIYIELVATCSHPRRRHSHRHCTRRVFISTTLLVFSSIFYSSRLDIMHAAGILIDTILVATWYHPSTAPVSSSTSYLSGRLVQLPAIPVPLRAVLTMSQSSSTYVARPIRDRPSRWMLIDTIFIVSSYLANCPCFSYMQSDAIHNRNCVAGDDIGDGCDAGCLHWVS